MENNHLTYFKIENFKKFDSLEVNNVGQFNLIVGDNNVGKTCLLEALLFDENFSKWTHNLHQTLNIRGLNFRAYFENEFGSNKVEFPDKSYFNYIVRDIIKPLSVSFKKGNAKNEVLSIEYKNISEINPIDFEKRKDKYDYKNLQHWLKFYKNSSFEEIQFMYQDDISINDFYWPFISFNLSYSNDLEDFLRILDKKREEFIHKTNDLNYDHKQEILRVLNKIFNYSLVDFQTKEHGDYGMISFATKTDKEYRAITQYGDGFQKIFRYIVEILYIIGTSEKRLMIDEIDTGIHHSKMKEFCKIFVNLCRKFKVQVFATTHSLDFQNALIEALEDESLTTKKSIRLIKLKENKDFTVKAITYPYNEFEYLVESKSETR